MSKRISRRKFLKRTGAGAVGIGVLPKVLLSKTVDFSTAPEVDKKQLVAALGDTIIPTADGYPGYKRLEQYGITDEVLKGLQGIRQQDFTVFNAAAGEVFAGKSFVDLSEGQRTKFLEMVVATFPAESFGVANFSALTHGQIEEEAAKVPAKIAGGELATKLDGDVIRTLQTVFRMTRMQVFLVFYRNFPEDRIARDKNKMPLLKPGDEHQIINPNTKELVTGWDVANYPGPLSWAEEEARRAKWMKIHWHSD